MALRSFRERLIQTFAFEAGGILLASPLYALIFGRSGHEGAAVVVAMSLAALAWTPLHNTAFDMADLRLTGRVASARPQRLRLVQAISLELTLMTATLPILMTLGGHGLAEAILVDLGFSALYMAYAYVFHLGYDWLRPVRRT
jgi:uncharacterized membrane protein